MGSRAWEAQLIIFDDLGIALKMDKNRPFLSGLDVEDKEKRWLGWT